MGAVSPFLISILAATAVNEDPGLLPQSVRDFLKPAIDFLPPVVRNLLPLDAWRLLILFGSLVLLFVVAKGLKQLLSLWKRKSNNPDWDHKWRVDLQSCPLPKYSSRETNLAVYHVPVRIRLVVIAPVGKAEPLEMREVPYHLENVFPGLGTLVMRQMPHLVIWPGQISNSGFATTFHRRMIKPEADGQPSQWIYITGRTISEGRSLFIGLGLWSDAKTGIGRRKLEPLQWLEVLRLIPPG